MTTRLHCGSELWITYHQVSRKHKQVTAQLIDVGEGSQLFDLEDVLDHIFREDFVDPKWRSVVWWEDCAGSRLKASDTVHDLLARGAGGTPGTALRLIIGTLHRPCMVTRSMQGERGLITRRSGYPDGPLGTLRIHALRALGADRDAARPPGPAARQAGVPRARHELHLCAGVSPVQGAFAGVLEKRVREAYRGV